MAHPRAVRRLAAQGEADHAKLLEQLNARPGETVKIPDGAVAAPDQLSREPNSLQLVPIPPAGPDGPPPVAAEPPAVEPPPVVPPTAPVPNEFEQRYNVLKGKYDSELTQMREQLTDTQRRSKELEQLLATVAPKPAAGVPDEIPESLRNEYGEEFFDVVGRRAHQIVSPELQELREKVDRLEKGAQPQQPSEAQKLVETALNAEVSDWRQVNTKPGFLAWLQKVDVFSGRTKQELLIEAYTKGDAARAVMFFQAFKQEDSGASVPAAPPAAPRAPQVDASELMAPGSPRAPMAPEAPGGKRIWTQAEIAWFYSQARRGKVPVDEKLRLEADILEAAREGRVR